MYNDVRNIVDVIIDLFDNNKDIKEMINLKTELLNDKRIVSKLERYEKLLNNPYDKECIDIKRDLLSDDRFKKYKEYEDNLFILTLNINHILKSILKEKSCYK